MRSGAATWHPPVMAGQQETCGGHRPRGPKIRPACDRPAEFEVITERGGGLFRCADCVGACIAGRTPLGGEVVARRIAEEAQ